MKGKILNHWETIKEDGFLKGLVSVFLVFSAIYIVALGLVNTIFADRAIPNLKINGVSVGGKTAKQIEKILNDKNEEYKKGNLTIKTDANKWEKPLSELNPTYDFKKIAQNAIDIGKNNVNLKPIFGTELKVEPKIDENNFLKLEGGIEKKENTGVKDAEIKIEGNAIVIIEGKEGKGIAEGKIKSGVLETITYFNNETVLTTETLKPKATKEDVEKIKTDIEAFINKPLKLKTSAKEFPIAKETLLSWVDLPDSIKRSEVLKEIASLSAEKNIIRLDKDEVSKKLTAINKEVNILPQNAVLTIADGRASIFTPSKSGQKLKEEESAKKILKEAPTKESVELEVETVKPEVYEENINDLGIKELIATGTSNFKGSSENRKHNIRTGAAKFQGVLIKPNEIFSFNKYLGEVDAANGYLPELVILNDKTTPQYGGGLCQVSSTVFRAALNSGLPIVARTSHAYPVKYYYPIGVDATIYIPNPDLKFKNDTGGHILMQYAITGDVLKFDFYGTKPKRTITFSGNENGAESVSKVEDVKPFLFNQDQKGKGSVDSIFYRFINDENGKLIDKYKNLSKYDSPDKYPKPDQQ